MKKTYEEYSKLTKKYVADKFEDYLEYPVRDEVKDHVIHIGCSILETKHPEIGPGYGGGSFVEAIVSNDLMKSFSCADRINSLYIKFYCTLLYNFSPYHL